MCFLNVYYRYLDCGYYEVFIWIWDSLHFLDLRDFHALSSSSPIHSSASFSLLLISSIVFFISVFLQFCLGVTYVFYTFVKKPHFSLCASILLPNCLIIFPIITLSSSSGRWHISTSVLLLGFCLLSSSETYSSVASFCVICYLYFYVCGRFVTFLDLGEVALVEDVLCISAVYSPSCYPRARRQVVPG